MSAASESARHEAENWSRLLRWGPDLVPELYADVAPREAAIVRLSDPAPDLDRLARQWSLTLTGPDLPQLAEVASRLAIGEAEDREGGNSDSALAKYEARRALFGERIVHWAVPWLDAVARCYPEHRAEAGEDMAWLLDLGDEMQLAPAIEGGKGLAPSGEDSFGPVQAHTLLGEWVRSLRSGAVILDATLDTLGLSEIDLDQAFASTDLVPLYELAVDRWRTIADDHPGTARLWLDLSNRAHHTAQRIKGAT